MASLAILADQMKVANGNEIVQTTEIRTISAGIQNLISLNSGIVAALNLQNQLTIDKMQQDRLAQLALADALSEKGGPGVAPKPANDNKKLEESSSGWIASLLLGFLAVKALISGFVSGLIKGVTTWIKTVDKLFGGFFSKVIKFFGDGFKNLFTKASNFLKRVLRVFDPVIDFFKNTKGKILKGLDDAFKPVTTFIDNLKVGFSRYGTKATGMFDDLLKVSDFGSIAGKIGAGFRAVVNAFIAPIKALELGPDLKIIGTTISDFFKPIIDSVKNFFSAEGPIGRFFSTIKSVFSFADEGSALMKTLGAVGRVVGKLFLPFAAIMTLWDTISGAFSGFIDDEGNLGSKVLSALEGGISGFLNSIIGIPLDLLKSGISWIAGKLGFTEAEKALDSFSFEDLIDQGVNAIFGFFRNMIDGIIEGIATLVEGFEIDLPIIGKKRIGSKAAADSVRNLKLGPGLTPGMKASKEEERKAKEAGIIPEEKTKEASVSPEARPKLEDRLGTTPSKEGQMLSDGSQAVAQGQRQESGGSAVVASDNSTNQQIVNNNSATSYQGPSMGAKRGGGGGGAYGSGQVIQVRVV